LTSLGYAAAPRRPDFERWRRRSRLIHILRVVLPVVIAAIFAVLIGYVVWGAAVGREAQTAEGDAPIRLVNPRFVGRDARGRGFVLTAASAVRDDRDYQRVLLDKPMLVLDERGPEPMRLSGRSGEFHEQTGQLKLSGGVRLIWPQATFDTATSVFETTTGELAGSGPISGTGPLGDIDAKSYGVYDKGERMIFKGGVRARIESN
jgi:lipopolysaccharide export system protein LptC